MGDIADGIINGDFDAMSGEYLGEGDGYPRSNDPSYYSDEPKSKNYGKNPGSGVKQWLSVRGVKKGDKYALVLEYARTINPAINENLGINKISELYIQKDFKSFTKWMLKRLRNGE